MEATYAISLYEQDGPGVVGMAVCPDFDDLIIVLRTIISNSDVNRIDIWIDRGEGIILQRARELPD